MSETLTAGEVCVKLSQWAEVSGVGTLAVIKSDLLARLIYGGEKGPSKTECPVHKGKWSGINHGWPGDWWHDRNGPVRPVDEDKVCRTWWDAGCRCFLHRGSNGTTGWQPDAACGCLGRIAEREAKVTETQFRGQEEK